MFREILAQLEIIFLGRPDLLTFVNRKFKKQSDFFLIRHEICFKEIHIGFVRKDAIYIFAPEKIGPDEKILSRIVCQYNQTYQPEERILYLLDDGSP